MQLRIASGFLLRDGATLSVQPAKFEKREDGGQRLGKDEALARKKQRMIDQRALADWDAGLSSGRRNSTVVLTGLFDAAEVAAEASAEGDTRAWEAAFYSNLRQDVEVECRKAGAVEKVTLFEGSERGAVAVRFGMLTTQSAVRRCLTIGHLGSGRCDARSTMESPTTEHSTGEVARPNPAAAAAAAARLALWSRALMGLPP